MAESRADKLEVVLTSRDREVYILAGELAIARGRLRELEGAVKTALGRISRPHITGRVDSVGITELHCMNFDLDAFWREVTEKAEVPAGAVSSEQRAARLTGILEKWIKHLSDVDAVSVAEAMQAELAAVNETYPTGEVRGGFMDTIDFQHELGEASGGTRIYPNEEDMRLHAKHNLEECGIVEVEVRVVREVAPQHLTNSH